MYNTGNPVPSAALEDMADNAQTFDALVTKTEGTTTDRLGRTRRVFQQILMDMGFQPLAGSFQTGATITARNQTLYDEVSHVFYAWGGTIPVGGYVVPAGSTPETTGGIGAGAWVDRTDVTLRSDLASASSTVIIAGVTAEKLKDAAFSSVFDVYASDYGVVADGVTDDTSAMQAAAAYASENKFNLTLPAGTIMVSSFRIPSNIWVKGVGIDRTIIKQLATTNINTHTVTNDANQVLWSDSAQTGFYEANNGNEHIRLSNMTIDGNGFRAAQYSGYGSALALSYVKHCVIENVKAINGHQHCIDVCGADYLEHGELGVYDKKGSFNVHLVNCQGIDPVSDDAITTHTSGNIWIYNPYSYNSGINVGYNQQGLEIDDGSCDVHVIGGYAKGFAKGLQIKGHSAYTMAANVCSVDGFISDGCKWGFNVEHGLTAGTTTGSAFAVTLKNCKNIRCKDVIDTNSSYVSGLKALMIDSYIGVKVENFTSYGDLTNTSESDYISIEKNSKCVSIDGAFFYDLPAANNACIVTGDSAGSSIGSGVRNTRIEHINAINCSCPVVLGMAAGAHYIDDIYAVSTSGVTVPYAVRLGYSALQSLNAKGSYVGTIFTSGYTNDLVSNDSYSDGTYARVPASDTYDFSLDAKSKYAYAGNSTTDQFWDFGVISSGSYAPSAGFGIGHRFRLKHSSSGFWDLAAIIPRLANGYSSSSAYLQFYLSNGTTFAARAQLNQDGTIRSTTDNTSNLGTPSYRWAVIYAGTGTINTSDEREKTFCDEDLSDAVLDVWSGIDWRAFKFNDAVAEKDEAARVHFGLGAQTVKNAFEAAGLDPFRYALLCYDEWDETPAQYDENGKEIAAAIPAGNRYGIRYDEALALEAALLRRTTERLEARLAALEAK